MDNEVIQNVPPQTEPVNPSPQTVTPTTVPDNTVMETPKKSKKVLVIILAVVLSFIGLIVAIILIVNSATKEPLKVSNDFLNAFSSQDAQTVYGLTSNKFQETITIEEFETFQNEYKGMNLDQAKVTGKSISSTNSVTIASFTYSLTYESEIYSIQIELVEQEEDWKIQSISIE